MTPMVKLLPLYKEGRGNLRFLGVEAPVEFSNLKTVLVIHIKTDMPPEEMNQLNKKLRTVFGQDTVVFTTSTELAFCSLEQVTPEEGETFSKNGNPAIVVNSLKGKLLTEDGIPKEI